MDFNIKSYKGRAIRINPETRYVCLTDMATASGKRVANWTQTKMYAELISAFCTYAGITVDDTVITISDGDNEDRGTWAHPDIAIQFAQWCNPIFAIQVSKWINELMTTGSVSIAPAPIPQLPSRELAVETAVAIDRIQDILSKSNPRLAQILIDCAMNDVIDRTAIAPAEFPEDKWYGLVQLADKMGIATNASSRVKLGQYIGKLVKSGQLDVERVQEERLCNGQLEPIWCYRDTVTVRSAIHDWANSH